MNAPTGELLERELPMQQVDTSMASLITRSEIDMQIVTAHKYPRSIKEFRNTALELATLTEDVAQECIYALPRDGKVIEGPSARFAEILVYSWRNCRAGARVVDDSGEFVTAQGVFMDLQQNIGIAYEVQRRIVDKNGRRYKPDMIGVTANAASSIALRNAVLKGVPKALWNGIYQAARKTVMGDFHTLANRRSDAITQFHAFGVTAEMICGALAVKGIEDIGLEQLVILRGIYTAIKDGDTTVEQAFHGGEKRTVDMPRAKAETQQPAATTTVAVEPSATTTTTTPKSETVDQGTGEITKPAGDPAPMRPSQVSILRAKMKVAALTDVDLKAKFGRALGTEGPPPDGWTVADYDVVHAWVTER